MSLETLRRRLQTSRLIAGNTVENAEGALLPLLLNDIELSIPRVAVQPTLEETQNAVTRVVQTVLGSMEQVTPWEHLARQQLHLQKVRLSIYLIYQSTWSFVMWLTDTAWLFKLACCIRGSVHAVCVYVCVCARVLYVCPRVLCVLCVARIKH